MIIHQSRNKSYSAKRVFIFLLFCFPEIVFAQFRFHLADSIPVIAGADSLYFPWAGGFNNPIFSTIDVDGDGRDDIFSYDRSCNRAMIFLNTGGSGAHSYRFAPEYLDAFPHMRAWVYLFDYNCDGRMDLFTDNIHNNGITQYKNIGSPGSPSFVLVDSSIDADYGGGSIGNILASDFLAPWIDDIDNDGDMDILGQPSFCVGTFSYFRNNSIQDFGVCDSNDFKFITESWGHFGLRSGSFQTVVANSFSVNCFGSGRPVFNEPARRDDTYACIFTIDIDGDGDKDALIGDSGAWNSLLLYNGGDSANAQMNAEDTLFPSYNTSVQLNSFVMHAYVDADHDGVKDLLVSPREFENKHGVWYYKNTGTTAVPVFQYQASDFMQHDMIDVGQGAAPVFFDADADGLTDLIIGRENMSMPGGAVTLGLTLFRNTGSSTSPKFQWVTDDYAGLSSQGLTSPLYPAFGDLDGDGDQDMIVGTNNGRLAYFMNTAGPGNPAAFTLVSGFYMGIDVGSTATPQIIDVNHDNIPDMIIGGASGLIKYFENTGSSTVPFFNSQAKKDTLGGIVLQSPVTHNGYAVPFVFSDGGHQYLAVSSMLGSIYIYSGIDSNVLGTFTPMDTLFGETNGYSEYYHITVSGADLNTDGFTDLVIGLYSGGVQVYYGTDPGMSVMGPEKNPANLISIYPNPAKAEVSIMMKNNPSKTGRVISISNSLGQEMAVIKTKEDIIRFSVHEYPAGMYVVRISGDGKEIAGKFFVQK